MKQILFVAYLFPPAGGAGVQRTVKFIKYLPNFGWQPTILTTSAPTNSIDNTISAEVPTQTPIHRVAGWALSNRIPWRLRHWFTHWILTVDQEIGWYPFAVRRGLKLLHTQSWQAIYSTSAPYTNHLVALRLKKDSHLPWIADFRDPWLDNFSAKFATPAHRAICAGLEKQIVSTADRVLVVSEPMRQQFLNRYPDLPADHFIILPNGFDPADFENIKPIPGDDTRFTLVYTGSLYGKRQSARPFLTALRQLLNRNIIPRNNLRVRFVGNAGKEAEELTQKWNLSDIIEFTGYLPHADMLAHQLGADALLLIIGAGPGSKAVFTGKIFEYMAAGKPILALVPPGVAADLLTEAQIGYIVPPNNPDAIVAILTQIFTDWQKGNLNASPLPDVVARYNRHRQTEKLANIFDEVSE